jgi:hypothetical protein
MEITKKEMNSILESVHLCACFATYDDCKKKWGKDEEFSSFPAVNTLCERGDGSVYDINPFNNTFESFLKENIKNGIIDFCIRASLNKDDKVCFYIHASSVDSKTADFIVDEDKTTREFCN